MTIKKAVERITWRLSNGWKANQNDLDAVNFIVDFVNVQNKKQIDDNQLIAKLYIYAYSSYLKHFRATVFDDIPRRELFKMLDRPIEVLIQRFTSDLNTTELYQFFQANDIKINHPILMPDKNKIEIKEDIWDYETVKENLERDINNLINLHAKKD